MIPQEKLDELRELEKAASPGPWRPDVYEASGYTPTFDLNNRRYPGEFYQAKKDSELIAGARNALPALLDEVELLREREAKMKEALKFVADGCLVPPDGGNPCLEDAIEHARTTLAELY